MMSNSGARGNADQMRQLAGMRGLMAKASGEIIETPITASFREGLTVLQYFSTHGARKGLADTALKTANSAVFDRRLVDVVQDVIVSEHDRGTDGIEIRAIKDGGEVSRSPSALGRVLLYPVYDPQRRPALPRKHGSTSRRQDAGRQGHQLRDDPLCADLPVQRGICSLCYGRDLARRHLANIGETVGMHRGAVHRRTRHAALTMRTFHIGGAGVQEIELNFEAQQRFCRVVSPA